MNTISLKVDRVKAALVDYTKTHKLNPIKSKRLAKEAEQKRLRVETERDLEEAFEQLEKEEPPTKIKTRSI